MVGEAGRDPLSDCWRVTVPSPPPPRGAAGAAERAGRRVREPERRLTPTAHPPTMKPVFVEHSLSFLLAHPSSARCPKGLPVHSRSGPGPSPPLPNWLVQEVGQPGSGPGHTPIFILQSQFWTGRPVSLLPEASLILEPGAPCHQLPRSHQTLPPRACLSPPYHPNQQVEIPSLLSRGLVSKLGRQAFPGPET